MKQNNDINGITPLQNYSSAKTSLPSNEPKGFKLIDWQKGTVNLDLGGGKTTFGTDYLKKQDVKNLVFDFNYSISHNKEIAEYVKKNKVDTVTCFNVLNVLDTDAAIENMCLMAAKALKADGTAYFQVYYKKGGKGASQNGQSYQQGEPLSFYVPFVEKYFDDVRKKGDLIIATKPIKTSKKSQWQFAFDSNEGILFGTQQTNKLSLDELKELYLGEWHNSIDDLQEVYKFAPERKAKTFLFDFLKKETSEKEFKKLQKQTIPEIVKFIKDEFDKFDIEEFFKICIPTKLKEWFVKFYFPKRYDSKIKDTTLQELELQLLSNEIIPDHKELKERIDVLKNRLADRIKQRPRLFINKQAYQRWQAYTRKMQKQIDKLESLLRIESLTKSFSEDKSLNGNNFSSFKKNPVYYFVPSLNNAIFASAWTEKAYNELCLIQKYIKNGIIRYERLAQERFGGENETDRIRRTIILLLGGSRSTSTTFRAGGSRVSGSTNEDERIIKAFAEYKNIWFKNAENFVINNLGGKYYAQGKEARVYLSKNQNVIYKIKNVVSQYESQKSPDLLKFFDELTNHNLLFPETKYEILGFGVDKNKRFCTILKQDTIKGKPATLKEIEKYFTEDNFKKINQYAYQKGNFIVSDLKPSNVVYNNGKCYIIDCFAQNLFEFDNNFYINQTINNLGSVISEPTKQTFYENLYNQLESIVKDDSFEKNGIRNFILSHIPEDYKNDDIEGIVEVFYQRLRALKCGGKGLGSVSHKFNIGDTIKMPSGVTAKIIDFVDGDKYKIEFDDTVAGTKKIAIYFWKLEEKAVLSDDYHVGDLVSYKGFEETVFQIVDIKKNRYIVVELGDRTRTKNEIPFADKDKLQRAVSPLLVKEMELETDNLGNIVEELQPSGLSGLEDEFSKELLVAEMRLLELERLKDFGEKIGGSAKDRYNGRKSKDSTENVQKTKGFNRLPTQDEMQSFGQACFHTKFKPNVSDFEDLGLNKIVARLCFFHYYGIFDKYAGYNVSSIKIIDTLKEKKVQDAITSYFIENKRHIDKFGNKNIKDFKTPAFNEYFFNDLTFYAIDFVYTALSMNLEKDLKDDFDYKNVLKAYNRGDKNWHFYRDKFIFRDSTKSDITEENKQRVFNLCYENAMNDFPLFRVMLTYNNGIIFIAHKDCKENQRTWRPLSQKYVKDLQQDICRADWQEIYKHYAELYVKGKELYGQQFGFDEPDKWRFKDKEGLFAKVREGKDWRNGRNAEPKDFIDTFGFRAVEFGETMPQKERWEHLNRTFDSFMDLCDILNIKPENISLGGTLALSFGSRGRGGKHAAAAHYEPTKKVINLTRRSGAGCLAHEWFHAFDNQVCDSSNAYATHDAYSVWLFKNQNTRHYFFQFLSHCAGLYTTEFSFYHSAVELDRYEKRKENYWQKELECGARAFEWYVIKKLTDKHQINEYLAQIPTAEPDRMQLYPYPHPTDYDIIENIYDGIFKSVQQVKTPTGVTIR